ncbi:acetyltransferase [Streptomyces sp. C10-9-1]|uniref:GNAT family N-acetyltransferase n=1 Tax=Streptomyces sp. C10-9-1 TaxID=1859285 RepID=UPI002113892F|nr:GNAT family N-acetyltransferase [Streptomyces sp. C10-9-1]MCQ6553404.1 acetyltransferase [Streptomyces sp. C10-9-1]
MTENMATADAARAAAYERAVPGFGTVSVVPLDPAGDAELVHGWVTEERARFWGMLDHTVEQVREVYAYVESLTTHHAYLVRRDGVPVCLLQTYAPAADPVGECYDVEPGDCGLHLLLGPAGEGHTQPGFTAAVLLVVFGFCFQDERHRRLVAEPDARNRKAVDRLLRAGFTLGPVVDKPEKRAQLAFLPRAAYEQMF